MIAGARYIYSICDSFKHIFLRNASEIKTTQQRDVGDCRWPSLCDGVETAFPGRTSRRRLPPRNTASMATGKIHADIRAADVICDSFRLSVQTSQNSDPQNYINIRSSR